LVSSGIGVRVPMSELVLLPLVSLKVSSGFIRRWPALHAGAPRLPQVEYDPHDIVRSVSSTKAYVSFKGRLWKAGQARG
jgi:hypothetical protein